MPDIHVTGIRRSSEPSESSGMVTTNTTESLSAPDSEWTVSDLAERFGSLPSSRIHTDVPRELSDAADLADNPPS